MFKFQEVYDSNVLLSLIKDSIVEESMSQERAQLTPVARELTLANCFTSFTSTKVQTLTQIEPTRRLLHESLRFRSQQA
jgi:hypothetical protein